MVSPVNALLLTAFLMFSGTAALTALPFFIAAYGRQRMVSLLGTGLLLGTSIGVVIPNGMDMLTSTQHSTSTHQLGNVSSYHGEGSRYHGVANTAGVAIMSGFLFTFVIEKMISRRGHSRNDTGSACVEHLQLENGGDAASKPSPSKTKSGISKDETKHVRTLFGLVIHSAVDGISIGATYFSGDGSMKMLVVFATMLHKAPCSIGFGSLLQQSSRLPAEVWRTALIFSASSPCAAILTYMLLAGGAWSYQRQHVALVLLFSGGTFLYVATTSVHDISKSKMESMELASVCLAASLPLIFAGGHSH